MPPYRALELLEQMLIALSAAHAARHHPPRREARERADHPRRRGQGRRLRPGSRRQRRHHRDRRHADRHGLLPRARDRHQRRRRRPLRHLRMRRDALRDADRASSRTRASPPSRSPTSTYTKTSAIRRQFRRGIPPYVDALVARATVRDRDQRSTDARVCCSSSVGAAGTRRRYGMTPSWSPTCSPALGSPTPTASPPEFVKRGASVATVLVRRFRGN